MDIIQLLPDSVANQIAAGEVIQRPASVIKELVENAIDAGAKNIQVLVCDAGKASIQVIDDGCGMSDTDARLSFERHATSKIRQANDLFALHTMGFRGEALASIAAVAQVTLKTRTADDELGTKLVIAGSKLTEQEAISCPVGSNFLIENLFYNIPARRKFLKSNATEMNNITQALERIILVYPEIHFTLYSNNMQMLDMRAANTHQRIIDVFGKRLNQQLLPINTETSVCKISGYVGKPESAKKKGAHQYFFVNGRYMRHGYFHKAVLTAFDRLLPEGEQVPYFIYFTVNPEDIDVNIHPVKTEIKFDNEQVIWQILMASVRDAVGRFTEINTLDFDDEGKPEIPVFNSNENVSAPMIDFNPSYNPFAGGDETTKPAKTVAPSAHVQNAGRSKDASNARGWDGLFPSPEDAQLNAHRRQVDLFDMPDEPILDDTPQETPGLEATPIDLAHEHYQLNGQYIVTQTANGMLITDQNRASQRILYEQYMKTLNGRKGSTQKILFPEVVQFPPSYSAMLGNILDELRVLGFEIDDLGGNSYAVAGLPAGLEGLDAVQLVNELVTEAVEQGSKATDEVNTIIASTLAQRAATPQGELLGNDDMESLMQKLIACNSQRYTPDGKPISTLITNDEIAKRMR